LTEKLTAKDAEMNSGKETFWEKAIMKNKTRA
jgi:hypothetical protein